MSDLPVLVPVIGMALLHFLWQGAVIGGLAALALHALRGATPQARYAAACVALGACVLAPVATVLALLSHGGIAVPVVAPASAGLPVVALVGGDAWRSLLDPAVAPALPWIVSGWAAGAATLLLRMAIGIAWVARMRATPQPAVAAAWQRRVDRLAEAFGLTRRVVLRLVDRLGTPASAGWWRPFVLLPTAVATRLPVDYVEALVAHELAHVRRHDYLVNLLQGLAEAALFFHPVTWWLSRRIRQEREQVADHLAAEAIGDPHRLARALAALATLQAEAREGAAAHPTLPTLAQAAQGGQLMTRIQSLIQPGRRAAGVPLVLPLAGLVLAGVALVANAQAPATTRAAAPAPAPASQAPLAVPAPRVQAGPVLATPRADARPATRARVSADELGAMRTVRRDGEPETLHFEHDGRRYVIDDPATVAQVRAAWRDFEDLAPKMEALAAEMARHGERMDAMGARMAQAHARQADRAGLHEATARLAALAAEQQSLALAQARVALERPGADAARERALDEEMAALDRTMAELAARMDREGERVDAEARAFEAAMQPLESLGREMELAAEPMEALGRRMEAIGEQQEAQARVAEAKMREVIAAAMARGLARPDGDASRW